MIVAAKAASATSPSFPSYMWVVVGSGGNLETSTSTTASSWTAQTSSFSTTNIFSVAARPNNSFVAVGAAGKLAISYDGITWTQQTSSFGADDIQSVAWSGTYWVACGNAGKIATSTDGITWTQRTSGTASQLTSTAYGNGVYLVAGEAGLIRSATDPTSTWTARTSTISEQIYYTAALHYSPDGSIWVTGQDSGTTNALASSTDGLTWTARTSTISASAAVGSGLAAFTNNSTAIIHVAPLSTGTALDIESSTDGITWTNRTPAWTTTLTASGISASVDDTGLMIVVARRPTVGFGVQSSSDGTTWTDRGTFSAFIPYHVCHSSGTPSI